MRTAFRIDVRSPVARAKVAGHEFKDLTEAEKMAYRREYDVDKALLDFFMTAKGIKENLFYDGRGARTALKAIRNQGFPNPAHVCEFHIPD